MIYRDPNSENADLRRLARQYRDEGYEVIVQPSPPERPDFLRDVEVDLLAKRGEETVVIEVKRGGGPKPDERLRRLSSLMKDRPGYRFDFIALKATRRPPGGAIDDRELCGRLRETDILLGSGSLNAALVVSWSAAEGALRLLAAREKVKIETESPVLIVKTLFSQGLLDREQYDLLERAIRYRNAAVHGFRAEGIHEAVVRGLVHFAKSILECP